MLNIQTVRLALQCLFHLSFSDINNFLLNLSRTNYKFLLTTTHRLEDNHVNQDIISGHFRHIDLFKTPFNFGKNDILERCEDAISGFTPREMILIAKMFRAVLRGKILGD